MVGFSQVLGLVLGLCLMLALLLLLALHVPFLYGFEVSVPVTGVLWLCVTLATCFSLRARCFGILLLISISLKEGRNLLITAGTTAIVFLNIQNSLRNLRGLAKSLLCTMEEKLLDVDVSPLSNYIQLLKCVASQLMQAIKEKPNVFGRYYTSFTLTPTVHSQNFKDKIAEAERTLNKTTENVLVAIDTASSVAKIVSPALGILLLFVFTALYLRRFRSDREHNIFITRNFLKYDEEQRLLGKPSVFPLSRKESERYIMVPSARFTRREAKTMLKFSFPIVTHSMTWMFFIGVDALLFGFLTVSFFASCPFLLGQKEILVAGVGFNEDQKVYNFSYDVFIFEKKCLPAPELWLYKSLMPLSGILALLVLLVVVSSKLDQLRVLVSEQFFADVAEERIAALHAKILSRRSKWKVQTIQPKTQHEENSMKFVFS
uniref:Dendritic cell-specific transmembrane protein-like domain-containing protein n=1 Tax=Electrophorus electricus TaxID=8005 RepID=A0A4W4E939_ELEEL